MRYQKVCEVSEGKHGKRFHKNEAPVVDWWKVEAGKYYQLCHFVFSERGGETTFIVSGDIIKVDRILRNKENWINHTFVYVKKLSSYTNDITEDMLGYDDDYAQDYCVLWPLTDEEVVEFKEVVKSQYAKEVDNY